MGIRKDEAGIAVQLYDRDGRPEGSPYFGKYVELYGRDQEDVVASGSPRSEGEKKVRGSADWLTLIAVADTPERLAAIVSETKVPNSVPHTSHSSRRVLIELHVGDVRKTFENRIAIASGPIVKPPPEPQIKAVHVKVLPADATMDESHPLFPEFTGGQEFSLM
jgi:hypothetical protein